MYPSARSVASASITRVIVISCHQTQLHVQITVVDFRAKASLIQSFVSDCLSFWTVLATVDDWQNYQLLVR